MKLYYQRLSREEKKEVKKEFLNEKESIVYKKANNLIFASLGGIIIAIVSIVINYINKVKLLGYIADGILLVFCIIVFLAFMNAKLKEINKYAIKKTRK